MNTDQQANKGTRADIPEKYRWRLEDIFPDDESWETAWQAIAPLLDDLLAHRGKLGLGAAERSRLWKKPIIFILSSWRFLPMRVCAGMKIIRLPNIEIWPTEQ